MKIIDRATGAPCGCEGVTVRGTEVIVLCAQHEQDFSAMHAAAVESCSHVARNQNLDLVGE